VLIYCSNLNNDQDMISALGSIALPFPLLYGDAAFFGNSGTEDPLRICVERKKVPDMASCILSGRYMNQVQTAYDAGFRVLCLALEGRYRRSPMDGLLEIPGYNYELGRNGWKPVTPAISFSRFDQYLTELEWLTGIIVKQSENVRGTADIIKSLFVNFQVAPDDHGSLKGIYKQPPKKALLVKPSLVRRIASELPGIGWDKSATVAEHFPTVRTMMDADVKEWISLEGIGKKIANGIVSAIHGSSSKKS